MARPTTSEVTLTLDRPNEPLEPTGPRERDSASPAGAENSTLVTGGASEPQGRAGSAPPISARDSGESIPGRAEATPPQGMNAGPASVLPAAETSGDRSGAAGASGTDTTTEPAAAPGVGKQFGNTRAALIDLVRAHVALLKLEIGEITGQVKTLAMLGGVALALSLLVANLAFTGLFLFLGEWLFGSLGWGLLLGVLLGANIIALVMFNILGVSVRKGLTSLLPALVLGVLVAILLGSNVVRTLALNARDQVLRASGPGLAHDLGPAVVGAIAGAIVLGVLGLIVGLLAGDGGDARANEQRLETAGRPGQPERAVETQSGGGRTRSAAIGLLIGVVVGAILGAVAGSVEFDWRVAVAVGLAVTLIAWLILQLVRGRKGLDVKARFDRFRPRESVEMALDTKAWVVEQWSRRRSKLEKR